jgi:hypothetical protein
MHSSQSPAEPANIATTDPRVRFEIRYDDLTQHAQVKLVTLPMVLGRVCFDALWMKHPLFETHKQGIMPILSRLVLESEATAVSFRAPLEGRGRIEIAHESDASGQVRALFMNGHAEIWGLPSRRDPSVSVQTRQLVPIGRAFGEHVLTRPFAAPSERKVLAFDIPGQPAVPSAQHQRVRVEDTASLPDGAQPLDADFSPDEAPWTFGLAHTDLNQHVNSLVYARLFEEAALRRCARHDRNRGLHARRLELSYRKPCFAGQSMVCAIQSYLLDGEPGAIGFLAPAGEPKARAHCSFRLQFRSVP